MKKDNTLLKDRVKTLQRDKVKLLKELKKQRELSLHWQYRCDYLLDEILCKECDEEKNDAYAMKKGYTWLPNCGTMDRKIARYHFRTGLPGY